MRSYLSSHYWNILLGNLRRHFAKRLRFMVVKEASDLIAFSCLFNHVLLYVVWNCFHRVIVVCFSKSVIKVLMQVSNSILTGITRFDLLGDFGRFNWLGNFYIVLSYNLLFAIMTTLCLVRKFTSAVREELLKALGNNSTGNLVCTSYYFTLTLIPCSVTVLPCCESVEHVLCCSWACRSLNLYPSVNSGCQWFLRGTCHLLAIGRQK